MSATSTPKLGSLDKTFQVLTRIENDAAIGALVPALDSPYVAIQERALRAILERRNPAGHREVLKRLHAAPPSWRGVIGTKQGRMTDALHEGVLDSDPQMRANACQAILWFREYDLVPALLKAVEAESGPSVETAAATLVALADLLFEEISAAPRSHADRRDPQLIRSRVVSSLEGAVRRFGRHERDEVMHAFLMLAHRDNVTLKQILQDPQHGTFAKLTEALLHNQRNGAVHLLLSFLDDVHAPSAAIAVLSRRGDPKFMRALLRKAGHPLSPVAAQNLKRVESLAWLSPEPESLDGLEEAEQAALVHLLIDSGLRRAEVFRVVKHFVRRGKLAGRIAAGGALAHFIGPEADALILEALSDPEPRLQAAVLGQLRQRGIPGAFVRLVEKLESPHECVRQVACASLAEFSMERFMAAFDLIDEPLRKPIGQLVRKINPNAATTLADELRGGTRSRRLRALMVADSLELVSNLEAAIRELLADEDHMVRREAAYELGQCNTSSAKKALRRALSDRSTLVKDAAHQSLELLESLDASGA